MLRKYAKTFTIGLQNTFVYRWNILFQSLFGLIPLAGTVFIWRAIFSGTGGKVGSYDYGDMIWYFLLGMIMNSLTSPSQDDWQIAADIREGQISSFMVKPMNYLAYRISLYLSSRLIYTTLTIIPVAVVLFFFRDFVVLPEHGITWLLFALSVTMAAALSFLIAYTVALSAFWILEISTLIFIVFSFEYFLSGQTFPIDIMPAWFREGLMYFPFPYQIFFPIQIFMEKVQGAALWKGLAVQAVWVALLWRLSVFVWKRGLRKYQAVGG